MAAWTGAAMLGAQVAWMRLAQVEVGSSLLAGAVSLAAAMAGLWLGAAVAGRLTLRYPVGRLAVVQQAMTVAVLLVSTWLIAWCADLAVDFASGRAMDFAVAELVVASLVGVALAALNVPFGMLLPIAVELDGRYREGHLASRGGLLYALQSGGAVIGALLLGLAAPAAVGFRWMLVLAGAAQAALLGWTIVAVWHRFPTCAVTQVGNLCHQQAPPGERQPTRRGAAWLAGWLGVVGLSAELVWLRGLSFYLRSSIYTYALTTAAFVGSLAVGGLIGAYIAPARRRPGQFLAAVVLVLAVLLAVSSTVIDRLPSLLPAAGAEPASLPVELLRRFWPVLLVIGPPVALMGLAFPLLLRLAGQSGPAGSWAPGRAGRIVGRVVSFNALGSVLGIAATYALVLGMLDERRALLAVAVGYMVAALWAEALDPATGWHRSRARAATPDKDAGHGDKRKNTRRQRLADATRKRIPWVNLVLFVVAAGVCILEARQGQMFREVYLPPLRRESAERTDPPLREEVIEDALPKAMLEGTSLPIARSLWVGESRDGVVATRRNIDDGNTELLIGQEVQGDDSVLGVRVQRFQGLLPLVLAPADRPMRALVIGLGTGTTVAPLVQAGVQRVTVAELVEPVVQVAMRDFAQANDNLRDKRVREFTGEAAAPAEPASASAVEPSPTTAPATAPAASSAPDASPAPAARPPQVRIINADGRTVLRLSPPGWDIILVDIIYPTAPGAGGLFSRQFYRLAYERLADDGVFVHWLPLWQMDAGSTAAVVRAFLDGFGERGTALRAGCMLLPEQGRPMLALIGGRQRPNLSAAALHARVARLRQPVDGTTSRYRPAMRDLGLDQPEEIWAGLVGEPFLSNLAGDASACTDEFPRTEFHGWLGSHAARAGDNLARMLDRGYGEPPGCLDIVPASAMAAEQFTKALASRRKLALAIKILRDPANDKAFGRMIREAVDDDENNAFARFQRDSLDNDGRLFHVRNALANKEMTSEQALAALSNPAARFPGDCLALWMKFALQYEANAPAALLTLEEILGQSTNPAAAMYWKARLLCDQAAAELAGPRHDRGHDLAGRALEAWKMARQARGSDPPKEYRELGERIRALLADAAKPAAASRPAGK